MRELHPLLIGNDALADPKSLRAMMGDHGYLFLKKPGETADFTVLRGGKPQKIQLTIP